MLLNIINHLSPIFFGSAAAADCSPSTLHLLAVLQVIFGYKNSPHAFLVVVTCTHA
jgi:hypothetical protein